RMGRLAHRILRCTSLTGANPLLGVAVGGVVELSVQRRVVAAAGPLALAYTLALPRRRRRRLVIAARPFRRPFVPLGAARAVALAEVGERVAERCQIDIHAAVVEQERLVRERFELCR